MARPPSVAPAPTLEAYYMRAYRAWRTGRGPNPGPRMAYIASAERADSRSQVLDAEREWRELRCRVLEHGGIRWTPGCPYDINSMPRGVYRRADGPVGDRGQPADLIAQLLGFDCDADLINALNFSWDRVKRSREGRA